MRVATLFASPVGLLRLVAEDDALVGVWFPNHRGARDPEAPRVASHSVLDQAVEELSAFFKHDRRTFDVPTRAVGTPFQAAVWAELARIPFGETRTYAQLAAAVGHPGATRAVGTANGANPLSIVFPCHRVIAANGALAGYAGGVEAKAKLLAWEAGAGSTTRLVD